jgi:rRNA-processing protein FCF1
LSSEKASLSRFNDKLVLSIATRKKIPLLTFDKELQGQAKRFGVKVMP